MSEPEILQNALRGVSESPPDRAPKRPVSDGRRQLDSWSFGPPADEVKERRPRRRAPVALGIVVAMVLGGVGFFVTHRDASSEPPLRLAMQFRKGHVHRYQLHMKMHGTMTTGSRSEPLDLDANMTFGMKVLAVRKGTAVVSVLPGTISGTANGEAIPEEQLPGVSRLRIATDGRILSGAGAFTTGPADGMGANVPALDQFTPLLPKHPVQPGDEWDRNFSRPFPFGEGKLSFTAHNEFLRYETVSDTKTAVIQTDLTVPLDFSIDVRRLLAAIGTSADQAQLPLGSNPQVIYGGNMTGKITSWFQPRTGQQVRGIGNLDFDMTLRFENLPVDDGSLDTAFNGSFDYELFRLS
jgi:hypothetical protein